MADEEAKLLAELKYLTNLIGVHKDEKTNDVAAAGTVRKPQPFNSAHGRYNAQGSRHTHNYTGKALKAQYSWTKPYETLGGSVSSKPDMPGNVSSMISGMAQKRSVSLGISDTRKIVERVVSPSSGRIDDYNGSQSRGVKKRTVVTLSKSCEKGTVAVIKSGTRETTEVGMPSMYNDSQSDKLVSAIVSSLPCSPSREKKRTVVLSPKKSAGGNTTCASNPVRKVIFGAIDCRKQPEMHIAERSSQSGYMVTPLSREPGVNRSKRTVCLPDSLTSACCSKIETTRNKCVGGSSGAAQLQHITAQKGVSVGIKCEPMIQLTTYKIVRTSPTKVATIAPANLTHARAPVCAIRTLPTVSTATITHQSRHRLVKVHGASGGGVERAPEAGRLVSTNRIACKPAVTSSSGTKLQEMGRYKLSSTRNSLKARRRRQDSVHLKRHDIQSKYKLVRRHSRKVGVAAGDMKLVNTSHGEKPGDTLSYGPHANTFTLTQNSLKTGCQNHDILNTKRHIVLSKYKLVSHGGSVTSLKHIASKSKLKKASSNVSWVPFGGTYTPSVLRSRKERRIKSPASWKKRYSLKRNSSECLDMSLNELLGREVNDVSRNKYKFIRGSKRNTPLTNTMASRSSLKVDHRKKQINACSRRRRSSTGKYVLIGGDVFKSSKNKLTRQTSVKRTRSVSAGWLNKGLSQHRWRASVVSPVPSAIPSSTRILASRAIYRSKLTSSAAKYRKNNTATRMQHQYCMFYNRFGKCNRGEKCPYIHDPDKVAVCTRFLRGTCKVTDCPFSHKVAPEKMPVCRFFLRGVCHKDDCPYLHVNVNRDAQVCPDFLHGYCPLGDKCKKKHSLVCADFERTSSCPRGSQCKLQHPHRPARGSGLRKRKLEAVTDTVNIAPDLSGQVNQDSKEAESNERESQDDNDEDDINLPLKSRKLPSFIALEPTSRSPLRKTKPLDESLGVTPLQIRPRLSFTPEDEEATPK